MSLSARLDFVLRECFLNAVNFEENYLIGFIIITQITSSTAKLRVGDWDLVSIIGQYLILGISWEVCVHVIIYLWMCIL